MTGEFVTTDTGELDILMLFTHAGEFVTTDTRELDILMLFEPGHDISNNMVCATSKGSDQPAHMRSLIRAFASHLSIL